jgi:hypothetical protein
MEEREVAIMDGCWLTGVWGWSELQNQHKEVPSILHNFAPQDTDFFLFFASCWSFFLYFCLFIFVSKPSFKLFLAGSSNFHTD